jgi:hypothetical protein
MKQAFYSLANLSENRTQRQGAKTGGKDRGQRPGAETGGRDIGQRHGAEKIGCHILLTSPIIAHQISTFINSVKPYGNFLRLFIFATVAFHSPITEVLTFFKPRL